MGFNLGNSGAVTTLGNGTTLGFIFRKDRAIGMAVGLSASLAAIAVAPPASNPSIDPIPVAETAPAPRTMEPVLVSLAPRTDALPQVVERTERVRRGDILMNVLLRAGAGRSEAYQAIEEIRDLFDPRDLRPGQQITLTFHEHAQPEASTEFKGFAIPAAVDRTVAAERQPEGGFAAVEHIIPTRAETLRFEGEITSSLFQTAIAMGAPQAVMADMVKQFSYDVDFQRDIWKGDKFELMFERHVTPSGDVARAGDILYAALILRGKKLPIYLFPDQDGFADYFNAEGKGVRKALMRTPINGARLSSNFGPRRHPILGYNRMHKGVDFAAPTGTPIYAAGDGWIEVRKTNGGFGKYIRIRHNSEFSTAYAHMHRYAKGLGTGSRVKQGQVIGYVGTTGRSTGPHLHYEIHKNGQAVNPMKVRFPSSETLKGERLQAFEDARDKLDRRFQSLPRQGDFAALD